MRLHYLHLGRLHPPARARSLRRPTLARRATLTMRAASPARIVTYVAGVADVCCLYDRMPLSLTGQRVNDLPSRFRPNRPGHFLGGHVAAGEEAPPVGGRGVDLAGADRAGRVDTPRLTIALVSQRRTSAETAQGTGRADAGEVAEGAGVREGPAAELCNLATKKRSWTCYRTLQTRTRTRARRGAGADAGAAGRRRGVAAGDLARKMLTPWPTIP